MGLQSIQDPQFAELSQGQRVLARFDFNVPLKDGTIADTSRVDLAIPTIKAILALGPEKLILMSHLGRPKGEPNQRYSLEPVATYLAEVLGEEVTLTESPTDRGIKQLLKLQTNNIILLENTRFDPREEAGDLEFARQLAEYGDVFVMDAFGAAHRKHASTYHLVGQFPKKSFAGLLLQQEVKALEKLVESPEHPFVALIGGAKVSDKIKIIEKLLSSVDHLLIGGAMAYPFLKAQGHEIGKSLCSDEDVALAKRILSSKGKTKLVFPADHLTSTSPESTPQQQHSLSIPGDEMGLDIGEKTIGEYQRLLSTAKTVLWNGPMGFFENPDFAKGTLSMATCLANLDAFTVIGGGDSVSAVKQSGLSDQMSHISTGGGASLEFIEKGTLPGIQALKFGL